MDTYAIELGVRCFIVGMLLILIGLILYTVIVDKHDD